MIIDYIKDLLIQSPVIQAGDGLTVDFLGEYPTTYSIEAEPNQPKQKQYVRGSGSIRTFAFSLVARYETFTEEIRKHNSDDFEELGLWLDKQSNDMPEMEHGRAIRIQATGNAYVIERSNDNDTAMYMMQCQLDYYKKGV